MCKGIDRRKACRCRGNGKSRREEVWAEERVKFDGGVYREKVCKETGCMRRSHGGTGDGIGCIWATSPSGFDIEP